MRAVDWPRHSTKQEDRAAARALPANQRGQPRGPSRRVGIPGWAGGTGHAPVPGSARDRVAIADRHTSGGRGGGSEARGSRAFAFGRIRRHTARPRATSERWPFWILPTFPTPASFALPRGEHTGTPKDTRIRAVDDGVASIDDRTPERLACVVSLGNIDRGT